VSEEAGWRWELAMGSQMMITGSLFSRRTRGGCDSGSICARDVMAVGNGGG